VSPRREALFTGRPGPGQWRARLGAGPEPRGGGPLGPVSMARTHPLTRPWPPGGPHLTTGRYRGTDAGAGAVLPCFLVFLACVRIVTRRAETPLGGSVAALAAIEPCPAPGRGHAQTLVVGAFLGCQHLACFPPCLPVQIAVATRGGGSRPSGGRSGFRTLATVDQGDGVRRGQSQAGTPRLVASAWHRASCGTTGRRCKPGGWWCMARSCAWLPSRLPPDVRGASVK